ncbi:hypothetical protein HPO96_29405 [Kribbella sandramycini]|uniref:Uncharacterized protein n=1 Tax=Kribbella sandramycini TaxID=60450 RepID=A0A7Y4L728_9ACTN|nr:hypothetical protein [Kribbella sandramycini]MBB6571728.1 hypothetical protein [Kribbella sandramycini]NOL44371.1 hypothetical protein [Kribbella sandramycini]
MRQTYEKNARRAVGRILIGAVAAVAMAIPAGSAFAAPAGQSTGSGPVTVQARKSFGPYVDLTDCSYWRGYLAGSGKASWVGNCERHPVTGQWWFLADVN